MQVITQILWAAMMLLLFGGAIAYAFDRHLGIQLFKRALMLLLAVLLGPSLVSAALAAIPLPVLLVLGAASSIAAYHYVTSHAKGAKRSHGQGASHAERHPLLPVEQETGREEDEQ